MIASALRAISSATAPTPRLELRKHGKGESNELPEVGRLAPEVIQRTTMRDVPLSVKRCYEPGLARNQNLEGRVSVRFVIELDGSVRDARLDSATLPDAEVARCIVDSFKKLHFPDPDGGTVTVVYPIMLSPG